MNIEDKLTVEHIVKAIRDMGWPDATVSMSVIFGPNGWKLDSATYKSDALWDPQLSKYCSDGPGDFDRVLAAFSSRQQQTKKFLEALASIKDMAEELEIPADFVNPLTAMADLLRTNILTKAE